ncbi:HET-domain-containing protein [Hyaloscypha variabilis F]|uniref:HET-domain-containing protein n=1 Tax=Hyaloscypha variabilis (strain UAMH 11265 / GT02V1 / F) TaxID=1149755 RepID=A0A2J6RQY2_HYAVF|nr:HET-domain-containing protein [Hyaloscypha variabilis F]
MPASVTVNSERSMMKYDGLVGNQIRLLRVAHSTANPGETEYSLTHVFLGDFPQYKALSYCWGNPQDLVLIKVNGFEVKVTRSLHEALQMFRNETLDIEALWVDALCINQEDVDERNHQVLRMSSIYRQAQAVLAWLGPEPSTGLNPIDQVFSSPQDGRGPEHLMNTTISSSPSFQRDDRRTKNINNRMWQERDMNIEPDLEGQHDRSNPPRATTLGAPLFSLLSRGEQRTGYILLQQYSEPGDEIPPIDGAVTSPSNEAASGFQRFKSLFSSPFWRRIWIVQEMTLATSILIVWGSKHVEWQVLCNLVAGSSFEEPELAGNDEVRAAYAGYAGYQTYRLFQQRNSRQRPLFLHEAIEKTRGFLSTNKLDMIYALLGITQDGPSVVPSPDYKISMEALQISITRAFVKRTLHLSIILMRGRSRNSDDSLPSWCPNWLGKLDSTAKYEKAYIYSSFSRDETGMDHLKPLQPSEPSEEDRWKAGGRLLEHWDDTINADPVLHVAGYFFDIIEGLTTEYRHAQDGSKLDDDFPHAHGLWQPRTITGNPYETGLLSSLFSMRQSVTSVVTRALRTRHYLDGDLDVELASALLIVVGFSDHWLGKLRDWKVKPSEASEWLIENRDWELYGKSLGTWFGQPPLWGYGDIRTAGYSLVMSLLGFRAAYSGYTFWFFKVSSLFNYFINVVVYVSLSCAVAYSGVLSVSSMIVILHQIWILRKKTDGVLKKTATELEKTRMRLIITRTGHIGLGHAQSRQGDFISVIKGCSMPVILRSYQDGFKVVGMAFVEGIMEGEMLQRPGQELKQLKLY